jgi:E3 ubiquitin-protein ligase RFWD2
LSVQVWSTKQAAPAAAIDLRANVCCVKYNPASTHELAVGSADHNVHLYDLRNVSAPVHVFAGRALNSAVAASHLTRIVCFACVEVLFPRPLSRVHIAVVPFVDPHGWFLFARGCLCAGHRKAVSYVRYLNSDEVISASTDNTLRLWNARTFEQTRTFSGHTNEKNFVGLAVDSEFIACGSETNEVGCGAPSLGIGCWA